MEGGRARLTNVTLSGNRAASGGGLAQSGGALVDLSFVTIAHNSASLGAGGVDALQAIPVANTIFASNTGGANAGTRPNCGLSPFLDRGGNVRWPEADTCVGLFGDPRLYPLALQETGSVPTHALELIVRRGEIAELRAHDEAEPARGLQARLAHRELRGRDAQLAHA